jgi:hypothetical protein
LLPVPVAQPGRRRIQVGLQELQTALRYRDELQAAAAARSLAGLGVGQTPAGDDVLMGVLHALWSLPLAPDRCQALSRAIVAAAAPRTTSLSAVWLEAAGRGEATEPWHDLVSALSGESCRDAVTAAVGRIRAMGHTSGVWALAGFAAALRALEKSERCG